HVLVGVRHQRVPHKDRHAHDHRSRVWPGIAGVGAYRSAGRSAQALAAVTAGERDRVAQRALRRGSMNKDQGLLSELKTLQRFATQRLAENESELRELSHADVQLAELQNALDGLQPDPARWSTERQALIDHIEELSRARAVAEARLRRMLDGAGQNAQRLQAALEQTRTQLQRAQQ